MTANIQITRTAAGRARRSATIVASTLCTALCASTALQAADDQTTPQADTSAIEEVVVTGTLLRGAAPVGSELISVSQQDIAATGASTTDQVLATVPQIGNFFNSLPQISGGQTSLLQVDRPNLRDTPSGTQATGSATLILVDGHRIVNVGVTQFAPDPDVIPPGVLERIEVNTDGGSSIYGADAIGGVINFITRRRFDGVEVSAHGGVADGYHNYDTNITAGKDWGSGSAYVSYAYVYNTPLMGGDRSYAKSINWTTGLPSNLECSTPTVVIGGTTYAAPGFAANTANACDLTKYQAIYPQQRVNTIFAGFSEDPSDAVKIDVRSFYTKKETAASQGPNTAAVSVSPTAAFYQNVPSAPGATQTVDMSFAPAYGNTSATDLLSIEDWGITPTLSVDFGHNWQLRSMFNFGESTTSFLSPDLNTALLGTLVNGPTPASAINPYDIAATPNSALLNQVRNSGNVGEGHDRMINIRSILDGSLLTLPGGDLRAALGVEYLHDKFDERAFDGVLGGLLTLPYDTYSRHVSSAFAELQIPIVGPDNRLPGMYDLKLSASGRFDDYSDFGRTTNPRFGVGYNPVQWITLRGNWGRSFNAPTPVDELGALNNTLAAQSFFFVPPPGQTPPAPGTAAVLALLGSGKDLQPQTATTYSFGFDLLPPVVQGLRASLTYYYIDYRGELGKAPVFNAQQLFQEFPQYVTLSPTPAQVAAFVAQAINPSAAATGGLPVYELLDARTYNLGNTRLSGLDFSTSYTHQTGFGSVDANLSGNKEISHRTQVGALLPYTSDLATGVSVFRFSTTIGANLGDHFRTQATLYHTGGYEVLPSPILSQDHVGSFDTVNLLFRYDMQGSGLLNKLSLSLNVQNILDRDPPIYKLNGNQAGVIGGVTNGETLGRLFLFGFDKKI